MTIEKILLTFLYGISQVKKNKILMNQPKLSDKTARHWSHSYAGVTTVTAGVTIATTNHDKDSMQVQAVASTKVKDV